MNKNLNKVLMVLLAVIITLSSVPISSVTQTDSGSSFAVVAQAATKKTHLNKTKKSIYIGRKYTLKLIDKKGKTIPSSKVKWSRSNKTVASVSKSGVVTGKKAGKIKITATYKGKKYTAVITVKSAVSVSKSTVTFKPGETAKKTIKVTCKDDKGIKWKTVEGSGIVKLSQAKKWSNDTKSLYITPTGKKFGTVKIKIYSVEDSRSYTYLTINVKKPYTLEIRKPAYDIISNYESEDEMNKFIGDAALLIKDVTYETPDTQTLSVTVAFEVALSKNIEDYYYIRYRVFDDEGYLVESDVVKSKLMMKGDKAKAVITLKGLENGDYTIEFRDYIGNKPSGNTPDVEENTPPAVDDTTGNKPTAIIDREALAMYQNAVKEINENGVAGYTKKSWQTIQSIDVTGVSNLQSTLNSLVEGFLTSEEDAEVRTFEKGSGDAMNFMPISNCSADAVKIVTKTESGSNIVVTIVMQDQTNPSKTDTDGLNVMSKELLYMEDVYDAIDNKSGLSSIISNIDKAEINYKNYTIKATMTKDGKLISIEHFGPADLIMELDTILPINIGVSGIIQFNEKYYDFKY